ncbi:MAG: PEP-CTERM sorting domain-containing protein, partial [Phycisphaerae bacterium]|nr:PEP-CTERM sorting domain-containing protein [Phycisphaerae bacterium]
ALRWERDFYPGEPEYSHRYWADASEGFVDPSEGRIGDDHKVWQYNFVMTDTDVFHQVEGEIYWLDVVAITLEDLVTFPDDPNPPVPAKFGWKTSLDHFNDFSVYGDISLDDPPTQWNLIELPIPGGIVRNFDQAFVVTPEPATMSLLCIGGMAVLRRRRRRRTKG